MGELTMEAQLTESRMNSTLLQNSLQLGTTISAIVGLVMSGATALVFGKKHKKAESKK